METTWDRLPTLNPSQYVGVVCATWRKTFTAWDTWFPLILALDVLVVDDNDYETGYDDADSAEFKEVPVT